VVCQKPWPCREQIKFNLDWLLSALLVFVDKHVKLPLKVPTTCT
jgi:hypothetical protein